MNSSFKLGILYSIFSFQVAYALVDVNNANFTKTFIDSQIPGTGGFNLKISRTYNSHSLRQGLFGYGWCSEMETKIDTTPEGNPRLKECGDGAEIVYYPREFDFQQINNTISSIIEGLKKSKKMDEKYYKSLAQELLENHSLRAQYAQELKISIPIKDGTRFYANGREVENIQFSKGSYIRTLADGSIHTFSIQGQLLQMNDKSGNYIKFERDLETILTSIIDNQGRKLQFKYYPNKKVKAIIGPYGISIEYKYENNEDLTWVKNQWNNVYTYSYDDSHNLIKVSYPDKSFIALTYDIKNDWVTSFRDRDGCLENYIYEFSKDTPKMHYWSFVKKTCQDKVVNESKHEFWYDRNKEGQIFLSRTASTVNGDLTDISYHSQFGRPSSITRNSLKTVFEYFPNGLVQSKISKFVKQYFEYSKETNKVTKVITDTYNDTGKKISSKFSNFEYNKKGLLVAAHNSEGQHVLISHDQKGRMVSLKDQAKKLVTIDYDDENDKPRKISRPGLGSIGIRYSVAGEMEPDAKEDPSVALQIASAFNNFLDIILPASAEVYL